MNTSNSKFKLIKTNDFGKSSSHYTYRGIPVRQDRTTRSGFYGRWQVVGGGPWAGTWKELKAEIDEKLDKQHPEK